jgi:hypothetical protein
MFDGQFLCVWTLSVSFVIFGEPRIVTYTTTTTGCLSWGNRDTMPHAYKIHKVYNVKRGIALRDFFRNQ